MSKMIAQIKLAPGEVGFYDPLTLIYLTSVSPYRNIYSHMNIKTIRNAIKSGRLLLISGSLEPEISIMKPTRNESLNTEVRIITTDAQTAPVLEVEAEPEIVEEPRIIEDSELIEEGVINITEDAVNQEDEAKELKKKKTAKKA